MFLHLLVPLDGSARAERALQVAAELAQQTLAHQPAFVPLVTLLRVLDLSTWQELDAFEEAQVHAKAKATAYLEAQADAWRREGLTVETAVRLGHPAEVIVEQIMARQVELVVMTTHGRSGLAHWALGSVAERVVRRAPVPVLLLPEAAPATLGATTSHKATSPPRILVPLDGSARAEAALRPARDLAHLLHAEVRLLSVLVPSLEEGGRAALPGTEEANRRQAQQMERYLSEQSDALQQAGIKVLWTFGAGLPEATILATASSHQASLIVMTTQGRGGLGRWRLGSVAEAVLHAGRLPVLLVPSHEPVAAGASREGARSIS